MSNTLTSKDFKIGTKLHVMSRVGVVVLSNQNNIHTIVPGHCLNIAGVKQSMFKGHTFEIVRITPFTVILSSKHFIYLSHIICHKVELDKLINTNILQVDNSCIKKFKTGDIVEAILNIQTLLEREEVYDTTSKVDFLEIMTTPIFRDYRCKVHYYNCQKTACIEVYENEIKLKENNTTSSCQSIECTHPKKYLNVVSSNLQFFVCPDCKEEIK